MQKVDYFKVQKVYIMQSICAKSGAYVGLIAN